MLDDNSLYLPFGSQDNMYDYNLIFKFWQVVLKRVLIIFVIGLASGCGGGSDSEDWAWSQITNDKIVFLSKQQDTAGYGEIYLLTKDGQITQIVDNSYQNYNFALSPDGKAIAFHRWLVQDDFSSMELFHIDLDTLVETRLTNDDFASAIPKWNPAGSTLVYTAWRLYDQPAEGNLMALNIETWTEQQLTTDPWEDNDPTWCGTDTIAFKSTRHTEKAAKEEIHIINTDGSNPTRLTTVDDWNSGGWQSDH
ncbi:MAG: hypothetical protein GY857_20620, partial [Desulfobacula sp.]|nr:hypothetical protein [Desulfobacula sp.]